MVKREASWWELADPQGQDKVYWISYQPKDVRLDSAFRLLVIKGKHAYFITSGNFEPESYEAGKSQTVLQTGDPTAISDATYDPNSQRSVKPISGADMNEITASERLNNARACIAAARYAEALADLVWFHYHALDEDPALSGVRRSFALGTWVDLGNVYPPALAAMEDTRDKKSDALLRGESDRSGFRDVAAIDSFMGATSKTYALFKHLMDAQPALAQACVADALPVIVAAADYQLAAMLSPDAEAFIIAKSAELNREVSLIKYRSYSRAPTRWAYVCNHVDDIQDLLKIKAGIGQRAEAARLKSLATALIESPSLRREVQACFVKRPRAIVRKR